MKKSLLALAVLGAFAGVASAQSSVTIYGIVDASVDRIDNGAQSVTRLASGDNNASRIGFKGVEDLGNGLKATFVLENGFDVSDGQQSTPAGSAFSRLAYVGLEGGFGAVRLGRQNSQMKTALAQIDPFETSGMVNALNFLTTGVTGNNNTGATPGAGGTIPERVSNQITYTSANYAGFSGQVGYVFGETAGDSTANRGYGLQLGYANGPLNVQFGYNNQNTGETLVAPTTTAQAISTKIAMLGATYDFGVVKLHGAYAEKEVGIDVNTANTPDYKVKSALVGVTVPFGASKIRAEYIRNNDDRDNHDNNVAAVSYSYSLSKRTTLYTTYARVSNDDLSNQGFGTSPAVTVGENTSGFAVGIQHNF